MVESEGRPIAAAQRRGRELSIRQKLLLLISLLVLGVVGLLALYLPARQIADMRRALESKALTYGRLVSKQVEPAIAFDDRETAREVFEAVAQDPDVESVTLLKASGEVLESRGTPSAGVVELSRGVRAPRAFTLGNRALVVSPVSALEGPRGALILELSDRELSEHRQRVLVNALVAGLVAVLFGALGASWIAGSLGRRLRAISDTARAVTRGDLDQKPVAVTGTFDEISVVSLAFNAMLEHIRALVEQIRATAREETGRLETLVRERTQELDERNGDLKRVLDNVGQGFVTLDRAARMSRERSQILVEWFGDAARADGFGDMLARVAPAQGAWFALGWESLLDDVLPLETSLDQLPQRLRLDERELEIAYRPLLSNDGALERVLVIVSDVTEREKRARAEVDEREATRLFSKILADRVGFLEFFWEANGLVERVAELVVAVDTLPLKRALHTLKGNAAIYGIDSVAELCHGLEERLAEDGALPPTAVEPLQNRWLALSAKVKMTVEEPSATIELDEREYTEILGAIERGVSRRALRRMVETWRLEPVRRRLARLGQQASALAARLGKGPLDIQVEADAIRVEREKWSPFWAACVHAIRNSIDHGFEAGEVRRAPARLCLSARIVAVQFVTEIADNGRGIDWDAIRGRAQTLGLPASTTSDLRGAVFADGLTTKSEATELSGRGIGMSALREACAALGGDVELESSRELGTVVRCVWPARAVCPEDDASLAPSAPARTTVNALRSAASEAAGNL
jgi:two-component system, chemotaxis family, sensor kinase CheA